MLWDAVRDLIGTRGRFVIATHVHADGDGLGSQLALCRFLRARGKAVRVINVDPPPPNCAFVAPPDVMEIYDPAIHDAVLGEAEVIFLLDNSSAHRLRGMLGAIQRSPALKVCIDHHPHPDTTWDVMVIDEAASATGEMIHGLIVEMNGGIPPEVAEPLYVAISTDTGHFRFSNTSAAVLRICAGLLEKGVDVPKVYQALYESNSAAFTRLLGAALTSLQLERDGRLGYLVVTRETARGAGAEGEDTSEIINHVLAIGGTRVALLFKELEGARTKVSLRSKGTIDVSEVAGRLGGGGHRNASGIVMNAPLGEAMERVLAEVRRLV